MAANYLEGDDSLKDLEMKATTLQAEVRARVAWRCARGAAC